MGKTPKEEFDFTIKVVSARFTELLLAGGVGYLTVRVLSPKEKHIKEEVQLGISVTNPETGKEYGGAHSVVLSEGSSRLYEADYVLSKIARILVRSRESFPPDTLTDAMIASFERKAILNTPELLEMEDDRDKWMAKATGFAELLEMVNGCEDFSELCERLKQFNEGNMFLLQMLLKWDDHGLPSTEEDRLKIKIGKCGWQGFIDTVKDHVEVHSSGVIINPE